MYYSLSHGRHTLCIHQGLFIIFLFVIIYLFAYFHAVKIGPIDNAIPSCFWATLPPEAVQLLATLSIVREMVPPSQASSRVRSLARSLYKPCQTVRQALSLESPSIPRRAVKEWRSAQLVFKSSPLEQTRAERCRQPLTTAQKNIGN